MTTFPGAPRLLKGGLVLLDPTTSAVQRVVVLQYNPDTLTRTLQVQAASAEGGDRSDALRLKAPPVETLRLEAELDATDALESPDAHPAAVETGLHPALAALEAAAYPPSDRLLENDRLARQGTLEIAPVEAPLMLFVWSKHRIVPVRLTELTITEEAFDPNLNPIRAKVALGLRVLSVADLGFGHRGGALSLAYQQAKERLATRARAGTLADLGLERLP